MEKYVGKIVKNKNGKEYVVLTHNEDRALLMGGQDFVVINDLKYFAQTGNWGGGTYFPHFYEEEQSFKALDKALYFFKHRVHKQFTNEDENED